MIPAQATETVWVTDAELIRRSGIPEKIMRANLRALDANPHSGFPKKDKLWGGRRHWPSVKNYWEERANRTQTAEPKRMIVHYRKMGARG